MSEFTLERALLDDEDFYSFALTGEDEKFFSPLKGRKVMLCKRGHQRDGVSRACKPCNREDAREYWRRNNGFYERNNSARDE